MLRKTIYLLSLTAAALAVAGSLELPSPQRASPAGSRSPAPQRPTGAAQIKSGPAPSVIPAIATNTPRFTPDAAVWMGRHWRITHGGMAGVAQGDPANVFVDAHGYLHLRIARRNRAWTAAEMFSQSRMGFGTYQWQVQGDIYKMDKSTVLALFPYGPAAHIGVDAENEIDTEFSQWNGTCHCNADFTVYPSTGHRFKRGASSWEDNFTIRPGGSALTTVRVVWTSTRIVFTLMSGLQPLGTTAHVLKTDTYTADAIHIPQVPMPVGMNFWCFKATPAHSQEAVVRSFQFQPR